MDDRRFDLLARALGSASTRRSALGALVGLLAGGGALEANAKKKRRKCDPECAAGQTCVKGACACDGGGAVCGASCCGAGQRCEGGACIDPSPTCIPAGAPCKGTGRRCCDGRACASGQGGRDDVACYVPAGGACATTADCVWFATCERGVCIDRQPRCTPTFPATDDAAANGRALQAAVENAASGDTIVLAAGEYRFDAGMIMGDAVPPVDFGLYLRGKTLTIERCSAGAAVSLVCPKTASYDACVIADGLTEPFTLTLRGVTVQERREFGDAVGAVVGWGAATVVLDTVVVEVASSNIVPIVAQDGGAVIIERDVTVRTTAVPEMPAFVADILGASITCVAPPRFEGYPSDNTSGLRCNDPMVGEGTISPTCGCDG